MLSQGQEIVENYDAPDSGPARIGTLRPVRWERFYDNVGKSMIWLFRRLIALRGITRREKLSIVSHELTKEMFEKRDQIGIWFIGEKEYYVSEADHAASMNEEKQNKDLDL